MLFLLRFVEAESVTSLILKRFLCNIWSWVRENWSESLRTDSVAVRVKWKSNRTKSYFSINRLPRPIFWQSLGIFDFLYCAHPPSDIYGRPFLRQWNSESQYSWFYFSIFSERNKGCKPMRWNADLMLHVVNGSQKLNFFHRTLRFAYLTTSWNGQRKN